MSENDSDELWRRLEQLKRQRWETADPAEEGEAELSALTGLAARLGHALAGERQSEQRRARVRQKLDVAMKATRRRRPAVGARRPLVAAVVLSLLLMGLGAYSRWRNPALDVNELVRDHVEYLDHTAPAQFTSPNARAVADWLGSQVEFPVAPIDLQTHGALLLGGRRCQINRSLVAFMLYQQGAERISLYECSRTARLAGLTEVRTVARRKVRIGSALGFNVAAWQGGEQQIVMVTALPMTDLLKLVATAHGGRT